MNVTPSLPGSTLGSYTIEREIGVGGMATVYLAQDAKHARPVAIKVLNPELGAVLGAERFLSEIRTTANLQHPHLLPLFDSGEDKGLLFYVMPYVEGETLRTRLDREKQLSIDEVVRLTVAIGSALDYAHRHGIIHRDLKPENILLHDGQPLVADFGIALAVQQAGGNRITQTGLSLGTPQYMSPEQATGDRVIDARTDIYSLGALAYEMLTGEPPHVGSTSQAIIARLMTEKPRSIRATRTTVPQHVEAAVERALAKLPADRWERARDFADAISGARGVVATVADVSVAAANPRQRNNRLLTVAGSAVLLLAAVAATVLWWTGRLQTLPPAAGIFEFSLPDSVEVFEGSGNKVAISRDGSAIAVVGMKNALSAVYLRRLDEVMAQMVRGTEGALSPAFSPDGKQIVFSKDRAIHSISVLGGTARQVVANGTVPSWGDDGRIYFSDSAAIYAVNADGGEPAMIATPDTSRGILRLGFAHVLPGSKAVLATYYIGERVVDSARLGIIDVKTGTMTETGFAGTQPRYSRSGHVLVTRTGGDLYAVPFSLRKTAIDGAPVLVSRNVWLGSGGASSVDVSGNNVLVLGVVADNITLGVHLVEVGDGGVVRPLTTTPAFFREPRMSPDGKRIVVRLSRSEESGDLWIVDVATGGISRLTNDTSSIRPEWTSNGQRVVYLSRTADSVRIVTRFWDRRSADVIGPFMSNRGPTALNEVSIARDDNTAVFRSGSRVSNQNVAFGTIANYTAMKPVEVASSDEIERTPRISPDGRFVAYTSLETGKAEVYVTNLPGPGPRVSVSVNGGTEPMWSPDGKRIFYRAEEHMMAARLSEQPSLVVTARDTLFRDLYRRYAWHQSYDVFPDGKRLLMVGNGARANSSAKLRIITEWPRLLHDGAERTKRD